MDLKIEFDDIHVDPTQIQQLVNNGIFTKTHSPNVYIIRGQRVLFRRNNTVLVCGASSIENAKVIMRTFLDDVGDGRIFSAISKYMISPNENLDMVLSKHGFEVRKMNFSTVFKPHDPAFLRNKIFISKDGRVQVRGSRSMDLLELFMDIVTKEVPGLMILPSAPKKKLSLLEYITSHI